MIHFSTIKKCIEEFVATNRDWVVQSKLGISFFRQDGISIVDYNLGNLDEVEMVSTLWAGSFTAAWSLMRKSENKSHEFAQMMFETNTEMHLVLKLDRLYLLGSRTNQMVPGGKVKYKLQLLAKDLNAVLLQDDLKKQSSFTTPFENLTDIELEAAFENAMGKTGPACHL